MVQTYDVRKNAELGRYAVASRNLKAGDVILEEVPFTHGPKVDTLPVCLGCYIPVDGSSSGPRCEKCSWPLCQNCSNNSTNIHSKNECEVFSKNSVKFQNFADPNVGCIQLDCVTPLRVLLAKDKNPRQWEEEVSVMEDHEAARRDTPIWKADEVNVVNYLHGPCNLKDKYSSDLIQKVIGILEVNGFESKTCEGNYFRCIYPKSAVFANSCAPNISRSTYPSDDFKVKIRATVDVPRGNLLYTAYTFTMQGTSARQAHLKGGKYFTCHCERCVDPTELGTHFSTLKCNKCSTGLITSTDPLNDSASWKCSECQFTTSGASVTKIITVMHKEIEAIRALEYGPVRLQKYEKLLKEYKWVLHQNHYIQNVLKQGLIEMYGRVDGYELNKVPAMLERKADLCCEVLQVLDVIEAGKTRSRAMMLYELHAPLVVMARSQFLAGTLTGEPLKEKMNVAIDLLDECIEILDWEDLISTEGYLAEIAKASSAQLKHTLSQLE